jgi:hypothetical protein
MLVGRMIGDEVDEDPKASVMGAGDELIERGQIAEQGIDVAEVLHVVSEVGHRGRIERAEPDRVDPERAAQILEAVDDALEISHSAADRVLEAARIDLIDDGGLPPQVHWIAPHPAVGTPTPGAVCACAEVLYRPGAPVNSPRNRISRDDDPTCTVRRPGAITQSCRAVDQ